MPSTRRHATWRTDALLFDGHIHERLRELFTRELHEEAAGMQRPSGVILEAGGRVRDVAKTGRWLERSMSF